MAPIIAIAVLQFLFSTLTIAHPLTDQNQRPLQKSTDQLTVLTATPVSQRAELVPGSDYVVYGPIPKSHQIFRIYQFDMAPSPLTT